MLVLLPSIAHARDVAVERNKVPTPDRLAIPFNVVNAAKGCAYLKSDGAFFPRWRVPHAPEDQFTDGPFIWFDTSSTSPGQYYYCSPGTRQWLIENRAIIPRPTELDALETSVVKIFVWVISLYAQVGAWLVWIGAQAVAPLLSLSSFITHPMVTTGWPFLLGLSNLGFIIALLFIAFTTMLQIESMGARRMLPRLLVGAILINFSLIIAGVILDLSRLMMAVMVRTMPGADLNNLGSLGAALLQSSDLLNRTFDLSTLSWIGIKVEANGWNVVFEVLQATLLIWLIAAGFVILIAGLFVRYIVLILLLIVSPLAYLALAFPNMGQYATKWWQLFLKYVFYGPIALFILLMVAALNGVGQKQGLLDFWSLGTQLDGILSVVITGAMFVAAAMAGSKFGIIGANATMSFANKRGRQIAGGMTKGLTFLPRYAGKRMVAQPVKDAARTMKENYASRIRKYKTAGGAPVGKWIMGAKRDKEGKPLPGEDTTIGQAIGRRMSPFKSKDAKAAADAPSAKPTDFLHPSYDPEKLIIPDVRAVLSPDQLRMFANIDTTMLKPAQKDRYDQQVKLLLNDTTVVRTMDAGSKALFMKNPDYQDQILRTLRAIAQQDSAK